MERTGKKLLSIVIMMMVLLAAFPSWSQADTGPNVSYAANPGFETGSASGWSSSGPSQRIEWGGTHAGNYKLAHYNASSAYQQSTSQVKSVPNGNYTLSVFIRSAGGQNALRLFARNFGGSGELQANVGSAAVSSWKEYVIDNINVTNGQIEFGVWSDANAGNWAAFDDFVLTRNLVTNPGFETANASGWTEWHGAALAQRVEYGGQHSGSYKLVHNNAAAYTQLTSQVQAVPNGTYRLSVWFRSAGGQKALRLFAKNFGGAGELQANVGAASVPNWTQYVIDNITVTNGQIELGVWSDANAGNWAAVDDFSLTPKWNSVQEPSATPPPAAGGKNIIGYVFAGNGINVTPAQAAQLTHINYAFANVNTNGEVVSGFANDASNTAALNGLKQYNPNLKILVSVGGWSWSDNFSDAALTDASRTRFADSAVAYIRQYRLDGVDIDWEFPGQPGEGNTFRAEDKQNYTLLLQKVREKLNAAGQQDGKYYLLTVATGSTSSWIENTEMDKVAQTLDFVNLMTYDYHGGWDRATGHHTNLYGYDNSTDKTVNMFLQAGVPAAKMNIGVAFYGRGWDGVSANQVGAPAGAGREFSYTDLYNNYVNKNGFTRYWDDTAKAPYLYNGYTWITYDDEQSLGYKTSYIQSKGLAGAMYWEHNQDGTGTLLAKLYDGLR